MYNIYYLVTAYEYAKLSFMVFMNVYKTANYNNLYSIAQLSVVTNH